MQNKSIEQLAKEERNAYMREYRKNNKEKIKQINANYWERKAKAKVEQDVEN